MNIQKNFSVRKCTAVILSLIIALFFTSCNETTEKEITYPDSNLTVSFIDVGQGDSILIQNDGEAMLIDAGENDKGTDVVNYLNSQGADSLKYAVGTHPHSDHIGGMDTVLENIPTETFICPSVDYDTKTWQDVLNTANDKNTEIVYGKPYDSYTVGEATFTIFAPDSNSVYSDLNNYSIVLKLEFGENSFLFTGDAEEISETEMVSSGYDLKADVLKVGHHGSSSSTSEAFLNQINPEYAVISCGENNEYGHPHKETLSKLSNVNVLRTDQMGTIVITSDGKNLTVENNSNVATNAVTTKGETATTDTTDSASSQIQYIGNKNSMKLHKADCPSVDAMVDTNKVYFSSKKDALAQGYSSCKNCTP
jgi:competence protein ComEC